MSNMTKQYKHNIKHLVQVQGLLLGISFTEFTEIYPKFTQIFFSKIYLNFGKFG